MYKGELNHLNRIDMNCAQMFLAIRGYFGISVLKMSRVDCMLLGLLICLYTTQEKSGLKTLLKWNSQLYDHKYK